MEELNYKQLLKRYNFVCQRNKELEEEIKELKKTPPASKTNNSQQTGISLNREGFDKN